MPSSRPPERRTAVALALVVLMLGAACSGDDGDAADASTTTTSAAVERPAGPSADLSEELTGGDGAFIATATPDDVEAVDYVERELVAAGTATSYTTEDDLTGDGLWTFAPDATAPYRTRVLVRAPADASAFSGTVMVEWLNVSAGVDAEPEWSNVHEEIVRSGDVWVGVSAQSIGVQGGPIAVSVEGVEGAEVAGKGLTGIDPERYGTLEHPGDGYAFDIFTQVARAVRAGDGLDGLDPERVIAAGQSQSAFAMVTYINGVQPLTQAFDGFLVHSRGAASLPLVAPGEASDIVGALTGVPTTLRTDQPAPIMVMQTESDVTSIFSSYSVRQDDSDTYRLWEVAGTAHADAHTVGPTADQLECGVPINDGAMHVVAKAAFRSLKTWATTGEPPPEAPVLEVTDEGGAPVQVRDEDGIAVGGLRTPPVDVPVATLSGAPGLNPSTICLLLGSTIPFTDEQLDRYPSQGDYETSYETAADEAIANGFALEEDRDALLEFADPSAIPG